MVKNPPANAGNVKVVGSTPGLERSPCQVYSTKETRSRLEEYGSHGQPRLRDHYSQERHHVEELEPKIKGGSFKEVKVVLESGPG